MNLSEYVGHEKELNEIAAYHCGLGLGMKPALAIWFFCVKIPFAVCDKVGLLEESFGRAGGEDADYCLRCHLAGVPVGWVHGSYVLHFMGKSTWRRGGDGGGEGGAGEDFYGEVQR